MKTALDMTPKNLKNVLYYHRNVVLDPGHTSLEKGMVLDENELREQRELYGNDFRVGMGAEAIKELLAGIDIDAEATSLRAELDAASGQKKTKIIKRLEIIESFRKSGNKLEWMILDVVPVLPADLRPMVQLDGGRFATSDLNELYRRVISRNNRLKKLIEINSTQVIINN